MAAAENSCHNFRVKCPLSDEGGRCCDVRDRCPVTDKDQKQLLPDHHSAWSMSIHLRPWVCPECSWFNHAGLGGCDICGHWFRFERKQALPMCTMRGPDNYLGYFIVAQWPADNHWYYCKIVGTIDNKWWRVQYADGDRRVFCPETSPVRFLGHSGWTIDTAEIKQRSEQILASLARLRPYVHASMSLFAGMPSLISIVLRYMLWHDRDREFFRFFSMSRE